MTNEMSTEVVSQDVCEFGSFSIVGDNVIRERIVPPNLSVCAHEASMPTPRASVPADNVATDEFN
jgi:hypothetical protein